MKHGFTRFAALSLAAVLGASALTGCAAQPSDAATSGSYSIINVSYDPT